MSWLTFALVSVLFTIAVGQDDDGDSMVDVTEMLPVHIPSALDGCDPEMIGFELQTGYILSAHQYALDKISAVLLTDCLEYCQNNETCQAVNFETGLCIPFTSTADSLPGALTESHLPVFTMYAQKTCLGVKPCEKAWCIDRVQNHRLAGFTRNKYVTHSRQECMEFCLGETDFTCRSANYNNATGDCELSNMDRITVAGSNAFQAADGYDYMENNCIEEPTKLCEFKKLDGRVIKTVDSVYQHIETVDDCRDMCLNSPYRCHSYEHSNIDDVKVCRLSHHSRATLSNIQEPYFVESERATYELSSCYNVSIDCRSGDMIARIQTSKLFAGKIYAKGSPNSCVQDVDNSLEFELEMAYDDVECNVRKNGLGKYINDVVIQHHDKIVTSSDLGLAVTCQYDLTNKSVTNEVDLGMHDLKTELSEEVIVDSPNVVMKITDRDGYEVMKSASVGDSLALRFEIIDSNSPYDLLVRELVAMDGIDSNEIMLIDADGCPTENLSDSIMGPIYKSTESGKILLSNFDAFKFPSSQVVQFRALVTPCLRSCEPVQCDQRDLTGELRSVISYGKRRRRRSTNSHNAVLVEQQIQITDKFGFNRENETTSIGNEAIYLPTSEPNFCVNMAGLIVAGTVFLASQLAIIAAWTFVWQRRRFGSKLDDALSVSVSMPSGLSTQRTDSLCKLYEAGYAHSRRF